MFDVPINFFLCSSISIYIPTRNTRSRNERLLFNVFDVETTLLECVRRTPTPTNKTHKHAIRLNIRTPRIPTRCNTLCTPRRQTILFHHAINHRTGAIHPNCRTLEFKIKGVDGDGGGDRSCNENLSN